MAIYSPVRQKIIITGACGHIGSAFVNHLLSVNHPKYDILAVDNMSTERYCSLMSFADKVRFLKDDFLAIPIQEIRDADAVVHLAAMTDAEGSFAEREKYEKTNVEDTCSFIDRIGSIDNGPVFVFPSSTSVYGTAAEVVDEETEPNPQSPYAHGKLQIENYLKDFRKSYDDCRTIKYFIGRLGTIYGYSPGIRFHTAIQKFCLQASLGEPLTVWAQNYEQKRPYLNINDACLALRMALPVPIGWTTKVEHNEIYNILTSNKELKEVIEIIAKFKKIELNFVDTPLLNQYNYTVSCEKFKKAGFLTYDNMEKQIGDMLFRLRNLG